MIKSFLHKIKDSIVQIFPIHINSKFWFIRGYNEFNTDYNTFRFHVIVSIDIK